MLSSLIIVFREVLEAALITGIVAAACKGLPGRGKWIAVGIAAGIAGALIIAAFAGAIANALAGMGQEIFNAGVLALAVVMLAWHVAWMQRHAALMIASARATAEQAASGVRPLTVIAAVIAVAVLREGAETALFLYGIFAGGGESVADVALGGVLGLLAGALIGYGMYAGLVRLSPRVLFFVTNVMVAFLAAGMAAQSVGFLLQADLLPPLGQTVWDTSRFLSEKDWLGRVLHTLIGYIAQPAGSQVIAYGATLAIIALLAWRLRRKPMPQTAPRTA